MTLTKPFKGKYYFSQFFHAKHNGIDVNAMAQPLGYGVPMVAPEKVRIMRIQTPGQLIKDGDYSKLEKGYGLKMKGLETGFEHLYWHCLPIFPVNAGDTVERGDIVAYMGNSGYVSSTAVGGYVPLDQRTTTKQGTHLHYEVTKDGKFIDPYPLIDWNTDPKYSLLHALTTLMATVKKANKILKSNQL